MSKPTSLSLTKISDLTSTVRLSSSSLVARVCFGGLGYEKTPGGTTTIERTCLILSDLKGGRPQRSENAHAPPLGCQGFNEAAEIDEERFPAPLWSVRVIFDGFSGSYRLVEVRFAPKALKSDQSLD
jgi:hypothetical protein